MDCYIAELDETSRISAIWVKRKKGRGPSVYDPKKHIFDPKSSNEFVGASKKDIVKWLADASAKS